MNKIKNFIADIDPDRSVSYSQHENTVRPCNEFRNGFVNVVVVVVVVFSIVNHFVCEAIVCRSSSKSDNGSSDLSVWWENICALRVTTRCD